MNTTIKTSPTTTGISSAHVELLNDMLQLNRDSAEGFAKASELAASAKLKTIMNGARMERETAARAIEPLVRAAGGTPDKDLSISGSLNRTWMHVREAFSPNGDKALINEIERAEDSMKEAYADALKKQLPPAVMSVLKVQANQVQAVHDTFSDLKHGRATL
ncbi:MAG: PA2169 family four-helix-bundle protein [Gemmatimonadota bacterium]